MLNQKAIYNNIEICRDLIDEAEKLIAHALTDSTEHSYLTDLLKISLSNLVSVSMKLEIASNITDSVD